MFGVDISTLLLGGILIVLFLNNLQLLRLNEIIIRQAKQDMKYHIADLNYKNSMAKIKELEIKD
jgi:hypothetical protein